MTFAEGFYSYFRACPLFGRKHPLNYNYRGADPGQYAIDAPPSGPTLKRYLSGSCVKEKLITLGSIEPYGEDVRVQIASSSFYEELEAWITEQDSLKHYPETPAGTTPIKLECLTDGYLMSAEENTGWYQIQLKLTYQQGGKR